MATALDRKLWASSGRQEIEKAPPPEQPATTVSGVPIDPLYTPENLDGFDYDTELGYPGQYPFTRGVHARCIAAGCGRCGSSPASARARQTNERFHFLVEQGPDRPEHGVRPAHADGPRQRRPALAGRSRPAGRGDRHDRRHAAAVRRHRPRQAVGVDDDQRPGRRRHGLLPGQCPGPRASTGSKLRGTIQNDTLKEFHAQNEIVLSARAVGAAGDRRDRVLHAARAAVEPGVDQRLSHSRGRLDGRAGAGLHAGRRVPLRRRDAWPAGWRSTSSPRG